MPDPILDEIRRVREELIMKHGGFDAYFKYIQRLDQARRRGSRGKKRRKAAKPSAVRSRAAR